MSRKIILVLLAFIVYCVPLCAQDYITHGATPNLYLSHKVAAKETWYSISRIYNLTPKEIALFNKLTIDKPLEIGQALKIPLTAENFSQNDKKGPGEVFVPVYHIVGEKEWMFRISVNHNKVPIEKLEQWNAISRDQAKAGTKLIVGYLKVKEGNAALATKNSSAEPVTSEAPKKETPVVAAESKKSEPAAVPAKPNISSKGGGGYFKSQFDETGKASSGVSGIFKSTSGWSDGKYYALMNNVTVGTIVKISFAQTNKSIFAKVLGELPDMKESAGLALRISDAAASELGAASGKFSVDIKY